MFLLLGVFHLVCFPPMSKLICWLFIELLIHALYCPLNLIDFLFLALEEFIDFFYHSKILFISTFLSEMLNSCNCLEFVALFSCLLYVYMGLIYMQRWVPLPFSHETLPRDSFLLMVFLGYCIVRKCWMNFHLDPRTVFLLLLLIVTSVLWQNTYYIRTWDPVSSSLLQKVKTTSKYEPDML